MKIKTLMKMGGAFSERTDLKKIENLKKKQVVDGLFVNLDDDWLGTSINEAWHGFVWKSANRTGGIRTLFARRIWLRIYVAEWNIQKAYENKNAKITRLDVQGPSGNRCSFIFSNIDQDVSADLNRFQKKKNRKGDWSEEEKIQLCNGLRDIKSGATIIDTKKMFYFLSHHIMHNMRTENECKRMIKKIVHGQMG